MAKFTDPAAEESRFIDLEIVESGGSKPYLEIQMPRNSWMYVLRWCLEHRADAQFMPSALPVALPPERGRT